MEVFSNKAFKNPLKTIKSFSYLDFFKALSLVEKYSKKYYLLGYIRYDVKEILLGKKYKSKKPLLFFNVYKTYKPFKRKDIKEEFFLKKEASLSFKEYSKAIKKIKEEIRKGNTYQVNYTFDFNLKTNLDSFKLYNYLRKKQNTKYSAFLENKYETVLSFSPELFFKVKNKIITTEPMKGTMKRGSTKEEDLKNIKFLKNDVKNISENLMIVDLLRNDLTKVAKPGSVKVSNLFKVKQYKTLYQMVSNVHAKLKNKVKLKDIITSLFPCGSITGAPKISTMKIIDSLEKGSRDVYCGAIAFLSPKEKVFSVPIRLLQKQTGKRDFIYRVGGGIVWDSKTKEEWKEADLKTRFLDFNDFKIIETMKVKNNKILFLKDHFNRMKKSALFFNFKFKLNLKDFKAKKDGILRISLSKNGKLDFKYLKDSKIKTKKIKISKKTLDSKSVFLKHKTSYRPWYEKTKEKIKNKTIFDEVFFNEKGELCEGSRTNVILEKKGKIYTPSFSSGVLPGIYINKLIKEGRVKQKKLYLKDLKEADKIYLCNSVRGIVGVNYK
jgi:para-aminobenzoate synthetase / 4-amino-4-deoxychorismate lyase